MKTHLTVSDIALIEKTVTNLRDRLLVRLIFQTGCRVSEELELKTTDVNLRSNKIRVTHLKRRIRLFHKCGIELKAGYNFCPGCGKKVSLRDVSEKKEKETLVSLMPLDRLTSELLQQYISRGGPVRNRLFSINRHRAWQIITELAEKVGLEVILNVDTLKFHNISPEHIREAFIIQCLKEGEDFLAIRNHLGLTSKNYTRLVRLAATGLENA